MSSRSHGRGPGKSISGGFFFCSFHVSLNFFFSFLRREGRWRRGRSAQGLSSGGGAARPHPPRVPRAPCDSRPDGGGARGPFVRPRARCECRAVIRTGRVHTAPERGQWGLRIATSQKSRPFVIQPLSPWLSSKLPTLISGGWRGKEPRRPCLAASGRPWRVPAPFRKELGTSLLHLDLSRRPPSFLSPLPRARGAL